MRKLLITGGAGFIGANFVHYWRHAHPDDVVIVLDALTYAGNAANLAGLNRSEHYQFVHGDINDVDLVINLLRENAVDTIVHFAAESHVDRSIHDPGLFIETNVIGTHSLLRAARAVWLENGNRRDTHRFHHVSTDEVYGSLSAGDAPFTELTPYAPNSPYAASKAASDHLVRAYGHTYGLRTTTSNCSNNYGPYQFPEKLIPLMIVNALSGQRLPVYGDGSNIRDWLHVDDHCRGIELVLQKGRVGETYNIGGNCERANIDLVNAVCERVDATFAEHDALSQRFPDCPAANGQRAASLIEYVQDRPGHDWRYAIDASKASGELGYRPQLGIEEGIDRTVRWMLDNVSWWQQVLDGSYRDWIKRHYG